MHRPGSLSSRGRRCGEGLAGSVTEAPATARPSGDRSQAGALERGAELQKLSGDGHAGTRQRQTGSKDRAASAAAGAGTDQSY